MFRLCEAPMLEKQQVRTALPPEPVGIPAVKEALQLEKIHLKIMVFLSCPSAEC